MKINEVVFKEFVRNGYAEEGDKKIWDISERWFLYSTPELAKSFLKLREFSKYKKEVIDREIKLIKDSSGKLAKELSKESFNLIDIFCGDGKKAVEFLKTVDGDHKVRYCPLNVNEHLVELASKNVKDAELGHLSEDIMGHISHCESHSVGKFASKLRNKTYQRNVFLLLGSVLSSFEINDYLYGLSKSMAEGDYLIIGNGVRVGERLVSLKTYKHQIWDDWFINLVGILGFSRSDVEYDARFGNERVEMLYRLKRNKKIKFDGKELEFRPGDEILTATLYKYYAEELEKFCKMYFRDVEIVEDKDGEYALVICQK